MDKGHRDNKKCYDNIDNDAAAWDNNDIHENMNINNNDNNVYSVYTSLREPGPGLRNRGKRSRNRFFAISFATCDVNGCWAFHGLTFPRIP